MTCAWPVIVTPAARRVNFLRRVQWTTGFVMFADQADDLVVLAVRASCHGLRTTPGHLLSDRLMYHHRPTSPVDRLPQSADHPLLPTCARYVLDSWRRVIRPSVAVARHPTDMRAKLGRSARAILGIRHSIWNGSHHSAAVFRDDGDRRAVLTRRGRSRCELPDLVTVAHPTGAALPDGP